MQAKGSLELQAGTQPSLEAPVCVGRIEISFLLHFPRDSLCVNSTEIHGTGGIQPPACGSQV